MSKIIVNYTLYLGTMANKVALGKARQDNNKTFERLGFPVEDLVCKNYIGKNRTWKKIKDSSAVNRFRQDVRTQNITRR